MGYIRKKDNGWSFTVSLGLDPVTMKYKQKSKGGFKTKKECQAAMMELETKINKGEYFEESKITLETYLKQWLENVKHNITESTYVFYKDIAERVLTPALGKIKLDKLKTMQIQNFLTDKLKDNTLSNTSVRHYYNILNIALNQAVKWQVIQNNPCLAVEPPKPSKAKIGVLKPNEVELLLNYTKSSEFKVMYIPLLLAITCGMRRGEILGLLWEDVDLEKGIIRVKHNLTKIGKETKLVTPKTDMSVRTIALLPTAISELKHYKENRKIIKLNDDEPDYVCCWGDGSYLKPDYVTHTFRKLLIKCELPLIRFHDLRHTHATLLLMQGVNPKIVSERLGHSKIDMTLDTYSHVLPIMQEEAALKLEKALFNK
ncbi:site-specific integrase [Clostridium sp. SYSU_GA19001]|uniref:site-specific integrase n=1 Tax=Clostridium caldaquaticum TaxID=2940653 RepID=UPI0020775E96|nr:site-specific integrase [Clostridium caldaquaticum]MCM8710489.1 site-specific integrase [Clostridium caldaquaticum]